MDEIIELKITGQDIKPENLPLKELVDVLSNFEDSIVATVLRDHSDLNRKDIVISLVNIHSGSIGLDILPQLPEYVLPAYREITQSFNSDDFSNLPHPAIESLRELTAFSRRRQVEITFSSQNGQRTELARITPTTLIAALPSFSGQTTLYGYVLRVGGEKPKVMLRLPDEQSFSCETTKDIAKKLANNLYSWVGLDGIAEWSADHLKLTRFTIHSITSYRDSSAAEAFSDLSHAFAEYYQDIHDIEQYVADLRGDWKE